MIDAPFALILGGSSGIGLATARKLAREGYHLCLVHRDRRSQLPEIEAAFAEIRSQSGREVLTFNVNALLPDRQADVITQMQAHIGESSCLRVLVHALSRGNLKRLAPETDQTLDPANWTAAGLPTASPLKEALATLYAAPEGGKDALSSDDIAGTIHAMATSLWSWTQALLAAGLFAPDARIIGLTSEGNQRAWPYYAAISAAKATLESLIRAMARELAPYGIRSNVVQAGVTDTPSLRMIPGSDQLKAGALLRNPFGRLTTPEDVANVIALLCTEEAAWINGALIPVDGGERLG